MPPFRYLGNILGCAGVRFGLGLVCVSAWAWCAFRLGLGVRFGLGVGCVSAWARAWEGKDCARALALTEAGRVPKMEDARFGSRSFARFDID